jgi:uncharacterized protein (TIGR00299 family) protein
LKTLYFDCFAGISGDMALAALIDAGADPEKILSVLSTLPVTGYKLSWQKIKRNGLAATQASVKTSEDHHHRGLPEILEIIEAGGLSERARNCAARIFRRLAEAEAEAHGVSVEKVHFHEVGAVDAIVDIVGTAVAADLLDADLFISSPVRVGFGTVRCAHGVYPIPAPGTAALLRGVPTYAGEFEGEWTTPTGAAILTALCARFEPQPEMRVERIGYGAGSREHTSLANLLRIFLGETPEGASTEVVVLEAEMDDVNPQIIGRLAELLPAAGALDWYTTPVQMKKNRPGILLTAICPPAHRPELADIIFKETTTIGYRYYRAARDELERNLETVQTPLGAIRVKVARRGGVVMNAAPEYEDCRKAAEAGGRPFKEVRDMAMRAYLESRDRERK